ncbi:pleckstrin domain-containing protein [Cavenderia fasciculata]|uniref:Pleckstrin domain-containing protein n=1 Tax=Cavenderia fasciculata TaxID=261658 RepID=F4PVW8_CACFS|nr:pleckstrin domain-containing protein [Cavenderia fasciculata]EGG20132.1 pleckstrin domain-containing protein [Cavenderia fasciculata]|eukprot:XP_004367115.1 pleckstrin domain-containing protein [Cavenderia fasciculata]
MYNSIVKAVRKTISADKQRFENETYDLDLTYICERVIAMSFPADGVESAYRNSIHDVSQMLNEHHKDHYKIFNLSERKYDYGLFNNNVYDWCGFPDHHAPPLALLFKIVTSMYNWLSEDSQNVAIVHCLAGKGRTGTVIACLLLYGGLFDNSEDAMRYFAVKRSSNNFGVTGPSQIRYTQYFSNIYFGNQAPNQKALFLRSITMHTIPKFFLGPLKQGVCPVLNIYSATQKGLRIFSSAPMDGDTKETRTYLTGNATLVFEVRKVVRGDILVVFSHISPFYRVEQIARFNFHTGMFQMPTLILRKSELDGADGDKRFSNDFHFKLEFEDTVNPLTEQQNLMYQKEIKKEIKWIIHESKRAPRNGSILFFPKNNSEKIKQAKDIASKQGSAGVHSGYLFKKGHNFKNWRRRWFVLKDNALAYYKSPKDATPAGTIPIAEIENILMGDETSVREGFVHCFQLITTKSQYFIAAENERDLEEWAEVLRSVKRLVQESGRLFIEILEAKYTIDPNIMDSASNSLLESTHEIDMITYVTLSLGKKRDITSYQSIKYNPTFQYAGDFIIYDSTPADLTIGLWFRSSTLNVRDTLVAELHIPHAQLSQPLLTEFRPFNRIYTSFLKDLSIKFGTAYKSTEDLNLYESKSSLNSSSTSTAFGSWQEKSMAEPKNFLGKARRNTGGAENSADDMVYTIESDGSNIYNGDDFNYYLNVSNDNNNNQNNNNNNNNNQNNNNNNNKTSTTSTGDYRKIREQQQQLEDTMLSIHNSNWNSQEHDLDALTNELIDEFEKNVLVMDDDGIDHPLKQ